MVYYIYGWIYENRVDTLHQITHMHFDFTTSKGLKITPSDETKLEKSKKRKIREWTKKDWHSFFFISSTSERKRLSRA